MSNFIEKIKAHYNSQTKSEKVKIISGFFLIFIGGPFVIYNKYQEYEVANRIKIFKEEQIKISELKIAMENQEKFAQQKLLDDKKRYDEIIRIDNEKNIEKVIGDENIVYFSSCGGKYTEGSKYAGKIVHCLNQREEEFICSSAKKGTLLGIKTSSGADLNIAQKVSNLIDNGNYEFSKEWNERKCLMKVLVSGIVDGNSFRFNGEGKVIQYEYYKGEFIITLGVKNN